MLKLNYLLFLIILSFSLINAQTIASSSAGGNWDDAAAWIGGVVPGVNNDVVIDGPVILHFDNPTIKTLQVNASGSLINGWQSVLTVNEDAMIIGTMNANEGTFEFQIGGSLQVYGDWYAPITFIGTTDHYLVVDPSANFDPDIHLFAPESRLILTSETKIISSPNFGSVYPRYPTIFAKEIFLNTDSDLILENARLGSDYYSGEFETKTTITGNNNSLYFNDNIPNSQYFIQSSDLYDLNLHGNTYISSNVGLYGDVVNEDSIYTAVGTGGWEVDVYGSLINNGCIDTDLKFNFNLDLSNNGANLLNNGYFKAQSASFYGDAIHYLTSSNDSWIYFTSEFKSNEGTVFIDSDFRIKSNFNNMVIKNLTIEEGKTLYLDNVRVGWNGAGFKNIIYGSQNSFIHMTGDNAWYEYCDIYNITFKGQTKLRGDIDFYDIVTNADTLSNWGINMTVDVFGDFINNGLIYCASYDLNFNFYKNLVNNGTFGSMSSQFLGTNDQYISLLNNEKIQKYITFDSKFDTAPNSYQWLKNEENIPGATSAALQFSDGLDVDEAVYYCIGSFDGGSQNSRKIYISNKLPSAFEIYDVKITNLNETETQIDWKTTAAASGFIFYAEEDTSNGYPLEAMETGGNVMEHSFTLTGLTTGSTYYFIIDQTDDNSNWRRSAPYSFVAGDINPGELTPFDSALASLKKLDNVPDVDGSIYYDGAFISNDIAYVVSDKNKLFKTTNGGQSWADVSPEQGTSFEGIGACPKVNFYNENIGAVAFSLDDGSNNYDYDIVFGYVWVTRDGGQTWSERFDVNEDQILHLEQVSENVTMVSGAAAYGVSSNKWFKKITYNSGNSSYTLADITPTPDERPHIMSGDWLDENNGVILAKLNYNPYSLSVFKTTNGGASWTNINGDLPAISLPQISFSDRGIQMIDEDTFIFSYYYPDGDNYETNIWATENGGTNWFSTPIEDSEVMLNSLSIHESADYGIVCGFNPDSSKIFYVMYVQENTWQSFMLPDVESGTGLFANELTSDGTIWIIGNNRSIWKSKSTATSIEDPKEIKNPKEFMLSQNYPNPFNPATTIRYSIPVTARSLVEVHVSLIIWDILGNEISTLVNENQPAGNYEVTFNATGLASGVYLYRLKTSNGFIATKKLILLR